MSEQLEWLSEMSSFVAKPLEIGYIIRSFNSFNHSFIHYCLTGKLLKVIIMCKAFIFSSSCVSRNPADFDDMEVPEDSWTVEVFDNSNWRDWPIIDDPFWPDINEYNRSWPDIFVDDPDLDYVEQFITPEFLQQADELITRAIRRRLEDANDNNYVTPAVRRRLNFD